MFFLGTVKTVPYALFLKLLQIVLSAVGQRLASAVLLSYSFYGGRGKPPPYMG